MVHSGLCFSSCGVDFQKMAIDRLRMRVVKSARDAKTLVHQVEPGCGTFSSL
jgi:hypothetical protein